MKQVGDFASFFGGFVAAEGSFNRTGNRFRFAIALADLDADLCETAVSVLGAGRIYRAARRQAHFHDEVVLAVQSFRELLDQVVPFMDAYLPPSKKRGQYLEWRNQLLAYWTLEAKRARTCASDGCERPRRARELCRQHYYLAFGR